MARDNSYPALEPGAFFGLLVIPALVCLTHQFLVHAPGGTSPRALLIIVGAFSTGAVCPLALRDLLIAKTKRPSRIARSGFAGHPAPEAARMAAPAREPVRPFALPRLQPAAWPDTARVEGRAPSPGAQAGMSAAAFAALCAREMVRAGWHACVTSHGPGVGADVVAEREGFRVALTCVVGPHPVSYRAVQQAVACANEQSAMGVVVSGSGYTAAARHLAATTRVLLLHHRDLGTLDRLLERDDARLARQTA